MSQESRYDEVPAFLFKILLLVDLLIFHFFCCDEIEDNQCEAARNENRSKNCRFFMESKVILKLLANKPSSTYEDEQKPPFEVADYISLQESQWINRWRC